MRIKQFVFALLVLVFGFAFAQPVDGTPAPDIAAWFASTAALAAIVAAVVAFLKTHVFKTAEGLVVVLLSIATGAVLGLVGQLLGYVEGGAFAGLAFGATAGLIASGGWDAVKGVLGKSRAG